MRDGDAPLEALVEAIPPSHWEQLPPVLDALAADPAPYRWQGGDRRDDGTFTAGWVEYGPAVEAALAWLRAGGLVTPEADWMHADLAHLEGSATALAGASIADAVRVATAIVRGERFSDGNIAAAVDSGVLVALLRRLGDWHTATPGAATSAD